MIVEDLLVCESYIEGKMTMIPFIGKGYKAKECLELVYTNVCGSFNVHAWEGYEYFISFRDDYPKFRCVYLMHRKFDA